MISGAFHPSSQEWRYYSREKSIIHTLHLAQLASSQPGKTALIASTAPTGKQTGGIGGIPMPMPVNPYMGANATIITNSSIAITCYGSVNYLGQILTQAHMGIEVRPNQIIMTPEESGYFVVHAEAQSDMHTLGYQGPAGDGQITLQLLNGGTLVDQSIFELFFVGQSANAYLDRILRTEVGGLFPGAGSFTALGINLGALPAAAMSMWAMKIADYD